jgi:hypothetical protein
MTGVEKRVEGDPTEGDHHADFTQQPELLQKVRTAVPELLACRSILGWGTPE